MHITFSALKGIFIYNFFHSGSGSGEFGDGYGDGYDYDYDNEYYDDFGDNIECDCGYGYGEDIWCSHLNGDGETNQEYMFYEEE